MTGGHNREEIAHHLAQKQLKKLYASQVERILQSDRLQTAYTTSIKASADKFKGLFN
jgi:hypothetical protein